jgi:FKBP-type peptidyl-prolyl cis-trans isomerase
MNRFPLSLLLIFIAATFNGCDNPEPFNPLTQLNQEVAEIDSYLAAHNLVAEKHVSGIRMVIDSLGGGLPVSIYTDPEVVVSYKGTLFGGGTFAPQATAEDAPLSNYIPGWQLALTMLPEGSSATVYIPSYFAYGNAQQNGIPPNSTLVFEIDFIDNPQTAAQITQFEKDSTAIQKFFNDSTINATYDSLGIWYVITDSTDGPMPSWYDEVSVKYTIKTLNVTTGVSTAVGTFEQEPDPANFNSRVIDYFNGIQLGLQHMPEGSKATFYVPSGLAFAGQTIKDTNGSTVLVPANTNIIVEMELVDIIE